MFLIDNFFTDIVRFLVIKLNSDNKGDPPKYIIFFQRIYIIKCEAIREEIFFCIKELYLLDNEYFFNIYINIWVG